MGVLPTGWPPTLAPQGPQVFEGILASSPLDVSGLCCSLHSKAFSPLTVSGKLWVVLVKKWHQRPELWGMGVPIMLCLLLSSGDPRDTTQFRLIDSPGASLKSFPSILLNQNCSIFTSSFWVTSILLFFRIQPIPFCVTPNYAYVFSYKAHRCFHNISC